MITNTQTHKQHRCHNIYRRGPPLSHSPPARYAASFTLLPTSKKAFLFGGLGGDGAGGGFLDDLWAWEMGDGEGEGGRWVASVTGEEGEEEEEPPVGPCARWGHTVVPYKGRMYLFGESCLVYVCLCERACVYTGQCVSMRVTNAAAG